METIDSTEWSMEWSCNNCGGMGEIPTNSLNLEAAIYIICSRCSHPTLYAWCEKCGEGRERQEVDLYDQPKTWVCSTCETEYRLPSLFYQRPVHFKPSEFSEKVRIKNEINTKKYEHINSVWLRTAILSWNKSRVVIAVLSMIAFLGMGFLGGVIKRTPLSQEFMFAAVIALTVFIGAVIVDIILWLISSVFILSNKFRKKQE